MQTDYPAYEIIGKALGPKTRVLDVGCGDATIGELLGRHGSTIDGIEPYEPSFVQAVEKLHYVSKGSLEDALEDAKLGRDYDVVLLLDVLEHFVDPGDALAKASEFLSPTGRIFTMIPNSAHWSFRKKILRGDWSYDKWGLFDRTHLRFFDLETATTLCRESGMTIVRVDHIPATGSTLTEFGCRHRPNLFALHFLFELKPSSVETSTMVS